MAMLFKVHSWYSIVLGTCPYSADSSSTVCAICCELFASSDVLKAFRLTVLVCLAGVGAG